MEATRSDTQLVVLALRALSLPNRTDSTVWIYSGDGDEKGGGEEGDAYV